MIRAPVAPLEEGERDLEGAVAKYLARVLRLRAGDAFVAFDPSAAREADAVIVAVSEAAVRVRFAAPRAPAIAATREVTWIQGFAKGDKCDAIVRDATELGATRVIIAVTQRSVVKLDGPRALERAERWRRVALEAARQCGRGDAPTIDGPCPWNVALASVKSATARFCLYERATEPLAPPLLAALFQDGPLAFAAGPEGGLEDAEVAFARDAGWSIASLGNITLRTETVAAAALGAVRIWTPAVFRR